ncbi:MAG: hypothetical protein AAF235_08775 [Planctomycetota bacterium]
MPARRWTVARVGVGKRALAAALVSFVATPAAVAQSISASPSNVTVSGGRVGGVAVSGFGERGFRFQRFGRSGFPVSVQYVASPIRTVVWPPQPPPLASQTPPPPPPTPREAADAALAGGDGPAAVNGYRDLLAASAKAAETGTEPAEPEAFAADDLRRLGLALLLSERVDEGAAVLRTAFATNPVLAERPILAEDLGGRDLVRRATRAVVRRGHELDSGSVWLSAAVLMQSDGRQIPARAMLDRAAGRGVEAEVIT